MCHVGDLFLSVEALKTKFVERSVATSEKLVDVVERSTISVVVVLALVVVSQHFTEVLENGSRILDDAVEEECHEEATKLRASELS